MRGVVPLREVAEAWGVSALCAKRRLRKLDDRIHKVRPTEPHLIVQFAPGGYHFVDISQLRRYLPGIVRGDDPDPIEATLARIETVVDTLRFIQEDTIAIRASVAG